MSDAVNPLPPFVTAEWLAEHVDEVVVCDVRWYLDGRSGADAYRAAHLPSARFVDLDSVLAGEPGPVIGRHPLPTPERFAASLSSLGIASTDSVVAYDDLGGMTAGRLVWMLRTLGQPAAILSGGLQAWPGTLETGDSNSPSPAPVSVRDWPSDAVAEADEVAAHLRSGGVVVDSRSADRYRGDVEPVDPRPGHVPGAINLPFADNLVGSNISGGEIRSEGELSHRFRSAGVDGEAVVYCGSGVSACLNVLAAEAAGVGRPRLYVGSWSGWSSDPDRPAATESTP